MCKKINVFFFSTILLIMPMFLFVIPPDEKATEYENRHMASQPEFSAENVFNGNFFDELEEYLTDRFAFRTAILSITSFIEDFYGYDIGGATMISLNDDGLGMGLFVDEEYETIVPTMPPYIAHELPFPTPYEDEQEEDEEPIVLEDTDFRPKNREGLEEPFGTDVNFNPDAVLYNGYYFNEEVATRFTEVVNSYREALPETVRVFTSVAPVRVEFMAEEYRTHSPIDEAVEAIYGMISDDVITVDVYNRIAQHAEEQYCYFRTDHHWTALGAYFAYLAFADAAEFEPIRMDNYIEHALPNMLGSFATGANVSSVVRANPDTLYYYVLDNGTTFSTSLFRVPSDPANLSYRVFLGGDHAKLEFTSSNTNGKTLVMIKDSFANALVPWLAPHYERVIVIDPRQYTGSIIALLANYDDADLYFAMYCVATSLADFVEKIAGVK